MTTDVATPVVGAEALVDGEPPRPARRAPREPSSAAVAARVARQRARRARTLLLLATNERRAEEIAEALTVTAADREVLVMPPWDSLPYDRVEPSRDVMGRRLAVLAALAEPNARARVVVTSPEGLLQRTPPPAALTPRRRLKVGDVLDRAALELFATRSGWRFDERVDEPGEIALLSAVLEIFPPSATRPLRVMLDEEDRIQDIRTFDPVTQRSEAPVDGVEMGPVSEVRFDGRECAEPGEAAFEARLVQSHGALASLFDHIGDPVLRAEPGAVDRLQRVWSQIVEAYETRCRFSSAAPPPPPEALYLKLEACAGRLADIQEIKLGGINVTPDFAAARSPGRALKNFVTERLRAGDRVILTGTELERKSLLRTLKRHGYAEIGVAASWKAALGSADSAVMFVDAEFDRGFVDEANRLTVVTPSDVLGGRVSRQAHGRAVNLGETELRLGDVVIHEDHGVGVLEALERVEVEGVHRDLLRLGYHGGASVLAPVEDLGRIWRYGSEASGLTLDRLNTDGWSRRRAEVSAQIEAAAEVLARRARDRARASTAPVSPPEPAYRQFAAGFAFPESPDQAAAIEAVLLDLASGRPMDRLICGDVGFGKTEVALRAAAAVALAGRQMMIVAPTTVLARQHYEVFRRRFESTGVKVGLMMGALTDKADAEVRRGWADGDILVAVGTQAMADEGFRAADLALVVIDEEHRFGAQMKADLAQRAPHRLTMSATPIPRTLQASLAGVQDVSILASPPARRRPVRTYQIEVDDASIRLALMREQARGGQSFVVVPRVQDIAPLAERLAELVPELQVAVAHGRLKPAALETAVATFAAGEGDVLLATNIIENGLDVPRANTMLVWRPDLFGLAQLHQLRGRVGRGRRQGFAYLMTDPDAPPEANVLARLSTLQALDRLGAGFAISARDLDLRGGGDLVGEEQAGHIRLIGSALYQQLLARAVREVSSEIEPQRAAKLNLGGSGHLPSDYAPDVNARLDLHARLAHASSVEAVDALHEEVEDRFGPAPEPVEALFTSRRLAALATGAGVMELSCGPKGTAVKIHPSRRAALEKAFPPQDGRVWSEEGLVVTAANDIPHDDAFIETLLTDLAAA